MFGSSWISAALPTAADRSEIGHLVAGDRVAADVDRIADILQPPDSHNLPYLAIDDATRRQMASRQPDAIIAELDAMSPEAIQAAAAKGGASWLETLGKRFDPTSPTYQRIAALLHGDRVTARAIALREGMATSDQGEIEHALANPDLSSSDPGKRARAERERDALDARMKEIDAEDRRAGAILSARDPRGIEGRTLAEQLAAHNAELAVTGDDSEPRLLGHRLPASAMRDKRAAHAHELDIADRELLATGQLSAETRIYRARGAEQHEEEAQLIGELSTEQRAAAEAAYRQKYGGSLLGATADEQYAPAARAVKMITGDDRSEREIATSIADDNMDAPSRQIENYRRFGQSDTWSRGQRAEIDAELYDAQKSDALASQQRIVEAVGGPVGSDQQVRNTLAAEKAAVSPATSDAQFRATAGATSSMLDAQRTDKLAYADEAGRTITTIAKLAALVVGQPELFAALDIGGDVAAMGVKSHIAGNDYHAGPDLVHAGIDAVVDLATVGIANASGLGKDAAKAATTEEQAASIARARHAATIGANTAGIAAHGIADGHSPQELIGDVVTGALAMVVPTRLAQEVERAIGDETALQRVIKRGVGVGTEIVASAAIGGQDLADAALNVGAGRAGHPGVELHNHFMGVPSVEDFARYMGKEGKPLTSEEMLGKMQSAVRGDADYEKLYRKSPTGEVEFDTTGSDRGKRGGAAYENVHAIEDAKRQIDELRKLPPSPETEARIRQIADAAVDGAMNASQSTPFDGAYAIRDTLVKTYIDPQGPNGERRPYENFTRMALEALARDGVLYSEQSQSVNKLSKGAFPQDMSDRAIADFNADRAKRGQPPIDVRYLAMVGSNFLGAAGSDAAGSSKQWHEQLEAARATMKRGDVIGLDFAGPETTDMKAGGAQRNERFREAAVMLKEEGRAAGRKLVLRPHVGEGYVEMPTDPATGKPAAFNRDASRAHYEKAQANMWALLESVEALTRPGPNGEPPIYDPRNPDPEIRFGHCTHATPEIAAKMKELGIVAEVNLGSNAVSGSLQDDQDNPKGRDPSGRLRSFDDHSLLSLAAAGVPIILSTDAQSVMGTSLAREYRQAKRLLDRFRGNPASGKSGTGSIGVTKEQFLRAHPEIDAASARPPYELSYVELPADMRRNIDTAYDRMHADAQARHVAVMEGDRNDARRTIDAARTEEN